MTTVLNSIHQRTHDFQIAAKRSHATVLSVFLMAQGGLTWLK